MAITFNVLALTDQPVSVSAELTSRELDLGEDLVLAGPVKAVVEAQRVGEKVHIRGTLQAEAVLACARCLNDYRHALQIDLDLVALPADGAGRASRQVEDNPEEEDSSIMAYEHDQVELLPEIRSALILALPMKPLCSEDCPGLCPECGLRLDETHAPHGPETFNGPFAGLKKVLNQPANRRPDSKP